MDMCHEKAKSAHRRATKKNGGRRPQSAMDSSGNRVLNVESSTLRDLAGGCDLSRSLSRIFGSLGVRHI
jgi:hypothetical protein